ncbi:hypothetical protein AVEN_240858-1, partial [Araneus ventricosus]
MESAERTVTFTADPHHEVQNPEFQANQVDYRVGNSSTAPIVSIPQFPSPVIPPSDSGIVPKV